MTRSRRTDARDQVVAPAKQAIHATGEASVDLEPRDNLIIASALAADHVVQSCRFGTRAVYDALADRLRVEFLGRIDHYEAIYRGSGERL